MFSLTCDFLDWHVFSFMCRTCVRVMFIFMFFVRRDVRDWTLKFIGIFRDVNGFFVMFVMGS